MNTATMIPSHLLGLRCLTLTPPWGTAIMRWGKRWENRGWSPPEDLVARPGNGGSPRLGIHQGPVPQLADGSISRGARGKEILAALGDIIDAGLLEPFGLTPEAAFAQVLADAGLLLGTVRVVDVVRVPELDAAAIRPRAPSLISPTMAYDVSEWMVPGATAWHVVDPQRLPEPVPMKGLQKLWKVSEARLDHERLADIDRLATLTRDDIMRGIA